MVFERLLRLTKKCRGYVVSGVRNASVGIATVTHKSFESQYYISRARCGTRSLCAMTAPLDSSTEHASPANQDHQKEHTEARLGFGFFLLNMQDRVREGDGERLMRLYKVALLFYKAYGHSHYAYST